MTPLRTWRTPVAAMPLLLAIGLSTVSLPAVAQSDIRILSDRLDRLERDVNALSQRGGTRGPAPAAAGGGMGGMDLSQQSRLDMIEAQLRELTGQVERALYSNDQLAKRVEKMQSDVDFRLNELEKGGGQGAGPATAAAPPPKSGEPTVIAAVPPRPPAASPPLSGNAAGVMPTGTAAQQYDNAYQLLRQARYEEAGSAFRSFLQQHPDHVFAENAQYWLGETFYVRQRYDDAAKMFVEGYQKYPKGQKAPDNLLKFAMALSAMDKPREACVALGKLREYPQAAPAIQARANSERTRLQCK